MFSKFSIQTKYSVVFIAAILLVAAGFVLGVQDLKLKQLRNEAKAVAEQVVSFRAWVAGTGVVWVNQLTAEFHDFLGEKMIREGEKIFSKNPALATRELSTIVSKSSTRAKFRVTSDEYRNPANAPNKFEMHALETFKRDDEIPSGEPGGRFLPLCAAYLCQKVLSALSWRSEGRAQGGD